MEAHKDVRDVEDGNILYEISLQMTAKLLALSAGHSLTAGRFLVLISVRGCVELRATVRLERLGQLIQTSSHLIGSRKMRLSSL
jgi:hypothetical protein